MLPDPKVRCPATGFKMACRSIVSKHDCPKFVQISGNNPQTGEKMDKFGCVDSFLPMLLIENSQQQRSTSAAVESFRNETVKLHQQALLFQQRDIRSLGTMRAIDDASAYDGRAFVAATD